MEFNMWLQSRLTAHGYPVGAIDGTIGKNTVAALKAFQKKHMLLETGMADEATVAALRLTSSALPPAVVASIPKRDDERAKTVWPRQSECAAFYGAVGTNQTSIEVPFDFFLAWSKSTRVKKITVHKKVAESASRVFATLADTYCAKERKDIGIDLFGGSLNVRKMRGGSSYSMHSWGIAIDFDPERNQLNWGREKARLANPDALPFWLAWEAEGWVSLGRTRNFDWMHIQAARL